MGDGGCCSGVYSRFRKNRCLQIFVFLVIFGLNGADLASDWMLYHDVKDAEQGLVFGPVESGIVTALFSFSIIGAITFLFELINLGLEIFKERAIINIDAASAIVVWFEDVPQITINVIIVSCREEAISFFQLSKASVVIVSAFVRMIIASVLYCRRKANKKNIQSCTILRCLLLIGSIMMVLGSAIVFTFTHAKWSPEGKLVFPTPKTVWKGEFDEDHYFRGAGIYLNLPNFNENQNGWIRLLDINELKHSLTREHTIKIDHDEKYKILMFLNGTSNEYNECYIYDPTKRSHNILEDCTNKQNLIKGNITTSLILKFRYIEPHNHLLLGDVIYNGKFTQKGQICKGLSAKNESHDIYNLRYFKMGPNIKKNNHLFIAKTNTSVTVSFYDAERHLVNILEAWRTGFIGCETSGSVSPHLNKGLLVPCDNSL